MILTEADTGAGTVDKRVCTVPQHTNNLSPNNLADRYSKKTNGNRKRNGEKREKMK
jgi:hypothetical protein